LIKTVFGIAHIDLVTMSLLPVSGSVWQCIGEVHHDEYAEKRKRLSKSAKGEVSVVDVRLWVTIFHEEVTTEMGRRLRMGCVPSENKAYKAKPPVLKYPCRHTPWLG
jgi:hypothetical protein